MSAEQRQVEEMRRHIVDELLTLKCPRDGCHAAFVDFTGCFALKCHRCSCGFCAYCLKDCGTDAHQHVLSCANSTNRGSYGGSQASFDLIQRQRRQESVRAYIGAVGDERVRARLREACQRDLADLGIDQGR